MSDWAAKRGLADLELRVAGGRTTAADVAFLEQVASVPATAPVQDIWNNFVTTVEDREASSGSWWNGIKKQLGFVVATGGVGGFTAAEAATGGDIKTGIALDVAGVGAGAGIAALGPVIGASNFVGDLPLAADIPVEASSFVGDLPLAQAGVDSSFDAGMADYLGVSNAADASAVSAAAVATPSTGIPAWLSGLGSKLVDYGLARSLQSARTSTAPNQAETSPVYSSPWKWPGSSSTLPLTGGAPAGSSFMPIVIIAIIGVILIALFLRK